MTLIQQKAIKFKFLPMGLEEISSLVRLMPSNLFLELLQLMVMTALYSTRILEGFLLMPMALVY